MNGVRSPWLISVAFPSMCRTQVIAASGSDGVSSPITIASLRCAAEALLVREHQSTFQMLLSLL